MEEPYADVGVVVGRFQTPYLTKGQKELLSFADASCTQLIVVLGVSPLKVSYRHPLNVESRRLMVKEFHPDAIVLWKSDRSDDGVWSEELDAMLAPYVGQNQTVLLFGGRDSFIPRYHGRHVTHQVPEDSSHESATDLRRSVGRDVIDHANFRQGVVWASQNMWPTVYPTVDIILAKESQTDPYEEILLVRKPHEKVWRFPGGFVSPTDKHLEMAARRELVEETGLGVNDLRYIGSFLVDDWRYKNEPNKIMTTLFYGAFMSGFPVPGDDVEEAAFFPARTVENMVVECKLAPSHHPLWDAYYHC